jgi:hypothetical protein
MATSGASVRLKKRLRQRFGISAPKLAIRPHLSWYWRALAIVVVLAISLAIAVWIYDAGMRIGGFHSAETAREIELLRARIIALESELTKFRSLADSSESSLQIEHATQKQLSRQARLLDLENAALKEDLAFFEGLVPASESGDELGVRIDNLRVYPGAAVGEYRYRMLVINNGGHLAKELKGGLQLLVKVEQAGRSVIITMPSSAEPNPQRFRFEIKRFHRLEGVFSVPPGAELRLLQDDVLRAKRSVTL